MRSAIIAVTVFSAATMNLSGLGRTTISQANAAPKMKQREPKTRSIAKERFQNAERDFALGHFEKALHHYELAYRAEPIPAFLFNIAQCYRNLGELDRAIFTIEKYLQLEKNKEVRKEVSKILAQLEKEQAKKKATELGLSPASKSPPSEPEQHVARKTQTRQSRPIYTRWWFLTAGSVVAAGVAAALLVDTPGPPETNLGVLKLGK